MVTAVYPAEMAVKPPFTNFANNHARDLIFLIKWLRILVYISFNPQIHGNGGISRRKAVKPPFTNFTNNHARFDFF